jgi:hypothetical protein
MLLHGQHNTQELKSEYLFKERQWPRTCIIEVRKGLVLSPAFL